MAGFTETTEPGHGWLARFLLRMDQQAARILVGAQKNTISRYYGRLTLPNAPWPGVVPHAARVGIDILALVVGLIPYVLSGIKGIWKNRAHCYEAATYKRPEQEG